MSLVHDGHIVVLTIESGGAVSGVVTQCENLVRGSGIEPKEGVLVTCRACLDWHTPKEAPPAPPKKRTSSTRTPTGRPRYRPHRSKQYLTQESLTFAAKAIMAAVEWYNRGGENQFTGEMLDQVNMAQRFCAEILVNHGRSVGTVEGSDD